MNPTPCQVTYIGHATNLIRLGDKHFLTDPNFSKKIFLKGNRAVPPGLLPQDLPQKIDAILISHACYDHLDIFSYKFFSNHTPIVCPKGVGAFIKRLCANPITEISHEKSHDIGNIKIHAVEIKQNGYRWLPGLRYTGSNGYVLESPEVKIYFAGNTQYGTHFKKAGESLKPDIALLPLDIKAQVGKKSKSLSPEEFLKAGEKLHAKTLIPIRWGVFGSSPGEAKAARETLSLSPLVKWLEIGESFSGINTTKVSPIKLASVEGYTILPEVTLAETPLAQNSTSQGSTL